MANGSHFCCLAMRAFVSHVVIIMIAMMGSSTLVGAPCTTDCGEQQCTYELYYIGVAGQPFELICQYAESYSCRRFCPSRDPTAVPCYDPSYSLGDPSKICEPFPGGDPIQWYLCGTCSTTGCDHNPACGCHTGNCSECLTTPGGTFPGSVCALPGA